jgi:hypothetical protein
MRSVDRILICALLAAVAVFACHAQSASSDSANGQEAQQLAIEQLKKTVVFLKSSTPKNYNPQNGTCGVFSEPSQGTGFFVKILTPELGPGFGLPILVTAKHVIRQASLPGGIGEYLPTITARYNLLKPNPNGQYFEETPLRVVDNFGNLVAFQSDDPNVDVAIIPISREWNLLDWKGIDQGMFVTDSVMRKLKVNEEDDVLFSGLFLNFSGNIRNYPVVRHGKIAMLPGEKVSFSGQSDEMENLIFAEVTSFGGNSGSPVFLKLGPLRVPQVPGSLGYYLLGVMKGFFGAPNLPQNSGIATIVPAEEISKIVQSPKAQAYIEDSIAREFAIRHQDGEAEEHFKKAIALFFDDPTEAFIFDDYAALLRGAHRTLEADAQDSHSKKIAQGRQPADAILLSPSSVCYEHRGNTTESPSQEVTLTNNLDTEIRALSISSTALFQQTNNCGDRLGARKSCVIQVAFTPRAQGANTGNLTVNYQSGTGRNRRTVDLVGVEYGQ